MADLALTRVESWTFRFTTMLTLSVVVAVMGMSANSAAVVIGAMLLAPLMTPVLGLAAALSMGLANKSIVSVARVSAATGWCVAIATAISALIPDQPLSNEVIARTSPDVRDLVVALAAGFAGSYATVRRDASSALPGVAVAVALVPPLAAVGITLEAGRPELAAGALLLYGANLAAIILAGVFVFVATGFVPPRRLAKTTPAILSGAFLTTAVVVTLAIPLIQRSVTVGQSAQLLQEVNVAVISWIDGRRLDIADISVDAEARRVSVAVTGLDRPSEQADLEALLIPILGPGTLASVQWTRTEQATTTTTVPDLPPTTTDEQLRYERVTRTVEAWLADATVDSVRYELEAVFLDGQSLRVDVVGVGDPPSVEDLVTRLVSELDEDLGVTLTWVPRSIVSPRTSLPTPFEVQTDALSQQAQFFAVANDLAVLDFEHTETRVTIEFAGSIEPDTTFLVEALTEIVGDNVTIDLYFIERRRLETTTTTS